MADEKSPTRVSHRLFAINRSEMEKIMDNETLISYAKKAMGNAYAPYSQFSVGAAVLTSDGEVFTGCNVENASFGATICAERCAILKAISEGYTSFDKIAIVSSSDNLTYPCGICRQFLSEFMEDGYVVLQDSDGNIREYPLEELIPYAFNLTKDL
ncbi:MAG: cytidine deaminase [Eubacteriales bacterium]|nr:cytidine deaminase [Eubacteriales bacterium]